jgi:hypothetical protein
MDSHPVPKNVLTVEFKLFGPLTINQFFKILMGSVLGLIVFAITPAALRLFALPLIGVCVGLGVMAALIEGFEAKLSGFLKAIFGTTQYVWSKQAKVPEALAQQVSKSQTDVKSTQTMSTAESLDDIAIDTLLAARRTVVNQAKAATLAAAQPPAQNNADQAHSGSYFDEVYRQAFGTHVDQIEGREQNVGVVEATGGLAAPIGKQVVAMGQNMQVSSQPLNNSAPRGLARPTVSTPVVNVDDNASLPASEIDQDKIHQLTMQINELKEQLRSTDPEQRRAATERIKGLFTELQELAHPNATHVAEATETRSIFGVVVDKLGQPVAGAEAAIVTEPGSANQLSKGFTKTDGTFSLLVQQDWEGEYIIEINHPNYRFPEFKIDMAKKNMGYKFRAI